jgi:hypothetical protein
MSAPVEEPAGGRTHEALSFRGSQQWTGNLSLLMPERARPKTSSLLLAIGLAAAIAALVIFLALPTRHHPGLAPPPEPFGPIRSVAAIRRDAAALTGQIVRLRGRVVALRDLNSGQRFPWDVVYTVDDGTGALPIHWFVQEQRPKELKPPVLPDGTVIVTGKVKRDLELDGKTYPVILHEQADLHNQEHPILPASPTLR